MPSLCARRLMTGLLTIFLLLALGTISLAQDAPPPDPQPADPPPQAGNTGNGPSVDDDGTARCRTGAQIVSVGVTRTEIIGNNPVDELLLETMQEALKSEVRQNECTTIELSGNDISLSDIRLLSQNCGNLNRSCLEEVRQFLNVDSFAYAEIQRNANSHTIVMRWYNPYQESDDGGLFTRVVNETVQGGTFEAENAAPKLAFKVFGGDSGTLIVETISTDTGESVSGAEVVLRGGPYGEGQRVGLTPMSNDRVFAGTYTMVLSKENYKEIIIEDVVVRSGTSTEQRVPFEPNFEVLSEASQAMVNSGWIVAATGGAFLVAGLVTGLMTQGKEDELTSLRLNNRDTANGDDEVTREEYDQGLAIKEDGETLQRTTNLLLGIGGALTVTGVAILVLGYTGFADVFGAEEGEDDLDDFEASLRPDVGLYLSPQGGGASLSWTF